MLVRSAFILNRAAHRHVRFLGAQLVRVGGQQINAGSSSDECVDAANPVWQPMNTFTPPESTWQHMHGGGMDTSGHRDSDLHHTTALCKLSSAMTNSAQTSIAHASQGNNRVDTGPLTSSDETALESSPADDSCINLYLSLQGGQSVMSVLVDSSSWKIIETVYQPGGILRDRWVYEDWFCWQNQLWHPRSVHHWSQGEAVQVLYTDIAERKSTIGTAPFDMRGFKSRPSGASTSKVLESS